MDKSIVCPFLTHGVERDGERISMMFSHLDATPESRDGQTGGRTDIISITIALHADAL